MPHVHLLINEILRRHNDTPEEWAARQGYSLTYQHVARVLRRMDEVDVFAAWMNPLVPRELQLDLTVEVDTGIYYASKWQPSNVAVALHKAFIEMDCYLPERWGLWFRHKGPHEDVFITPENRAMIEREIEQLNTT